MKKISFLIIGIIYSLSCMGQQVALSDTVSINLPAGMETLNKNQAASYVNNKFSHSKTALNIILSPGERTDNKNFYKVGDVLIKLVHGNRPIRKKDSYLSDLKKGLDAMHRRFGDTTNYTSVIKTINNNHILITNDESENVGYYRFYCNDSTNTHGLNGVLQFDLADKDKATKILEDILNSVEFAK